MKEEMSVWKKFIVLCQRVPQDCAWQCWFDLISDQLFNPKKIEARYETEVSFQETLNQHWK